MPGKGRPFKKGQSGNPKGMAAMPKELRDLRRHTAAEIRLLIAMLLRSTREEVEAAEANEQEPILNRIFAQVLIKTYETGNFMTLDSVLNRLIGKVKERFEIDDERPDRKPLSLEDLKALSLAIRNKK
jgi:hypothetical protein